LRSNCECIRFVYC